MIQRIQTLYLALVSIACIVLFLFPLVQYIHPMQGTYLFYVSGMKYMIDPPVIVRFWTTFPLLLIILLILALSTVSVFLYKNRKIQVLLVNIAFLLNILLISLVFLFYNGYFEKLLNTPVSYRFGIFIPLVSLGLLILASRAIRKDESMVRSADRLR